LQLIREATLDLDAIIRRLFDEIKDASDEAREDTHRAVTLGRGKLAFGYPIATKVQPQLPSLYGQPAEWTIATAGTLSVTRAKVIRPQRTDRDIPVFYAGRATPEDQDYRWSATLFFGKSSKDPNYRWREMAFWSFNRSSDGQDEPYALRPDGEEFQMVFSNVIGGTSAAYGPFSIDGEDEEAFQHRWLTLFTKAVNGELSRPNQMPVPDHYLR
jgi:serine/threonine-protein kinase